MTPRPTPMSIALVNARYLWETGAEIKTQGQSLLVTTTFPIGSKHGGSRH